MRLRAPPIVDRVALTGVAIFGSFDHKNWQPWGPSKSGGAVKRHSRILEALHHIYTVVSDPMNDSVWTGLEKANPPYTRIQLFDQVWWACRYADDRRAAAGIVVS
jgi:hypothetical protein